MNTTCVVASYNYGHLAAHALESVLAQTYRVSEIIVVDDGVGDMKHLPEIYPHKNIRWLLRPENMGTVANFNDVLFNHVRTEFVMFLGADNYLHPDAFGAFYSQCSRDIDLVSYDLAIFGTEGYEFAQLVGCTLRDRGNWVWEFTPKDMEQQNWIHGSSLYRADLARKVGGYKRGPNKNSEEDWMLWRAMLKAGARHLHLNQALMYYRRHERNFTRYGS